MKILAIGPLPPPLHGQSIADSMAFEALARTEDVTVIDTTIEREFTGDKLPPIWSPGRLAAIVSILRREPIKTSRSHNCWVQNFLAVCGSNHNHIATAIKSVHFFQKLI